MRKINKIVIHCSATPPDMDIGVDAIRRWHKAKGWHDIGYHAVIRRNGRVEDGRNIEIAGAHAKGFNAYSIGVCLVGGVDEDGKPEFNFTQAQIEALDALYEVVEHEYPDADWIGHKDLPGVQKACPCFDVREYFYGA